MSETKNLNRRDFITKGSLAVAGATLAVSGLGAILTGCSPEAPTPTPPVSAAPPEAPAWPLTWTKLSLDAVEERSYKSYKEAG